MINWERIARAVVFYKTCGYRYIETPWAVPEATHSLTSDKAPKISENIPVASAEQGFLHLMLRGKLLPGVDYVSAGPCFRPEDEGRPFSQPHFFKVELFKYSSSGYKVDVVDHLLPATQFFYSELGHYPKRLCTNDHTGDADLLLEDIEIGSYGTRSFEDRLFWSYGTGLAEPRFQMAMDYGKELS